MVLLLLVFMQLTRDLFAIAKFLFVGLHDVHADAHMLSVLRMI